MQLAAPHTEIALIISGSPFDKALICVVHGASWFDGCSIALLLPVPQPLQSNLWRYPEGDYRREMRDRDIAPTAQGAGEYPLVMMFQIIQQKPLTLSDLALRLKGWISG